MAQKDLPADETQIKKQAAEYFKEKKFADAYPLYSQLLSLYSTNPDYNYRLAVCMLYAKTDKERPIHYLEIAVQSSDVENLAYYYLGWAYQVNYRFSEAINSYEKFNGKATSSEADKYPVDRLIQFCNNGIQQLSNFQNLDVLRKKELSSSTFYYAYPVQEIGGSLVHEPDDLKSAEDKKHNLNSLIFSAHGKKYIFFPVMVRTLKTEKIFSCGRSNLTEAGVCL